MRSVLKSCVPALLVASLSLVATGVASAADLLDRIKEKGEIVIASEARYPPFEYVENGKIVRKQAFRKNRPVLQPRY